MESVKFLDMTVHTCGDLPKDGTVAPEFVLTGQDLSDITLEQFKGKNVVLNIFPSIDTDVCAASVRHFNKDISEMDNTVVVCVSEDLPFAAARFCAANDIKNVYTGSAFRSDFGEKYGIKMVDGPLKGLLARAVVVIGPDGIVKGHFLCPILTEEPDYGKVKEMVKK